MFSKSRKMILSLLSASLVTASLASCSQEELINRATGAVIGAGVGLIQAQFITPQQEVEMGERIRQEVFQEYKIYTQSPALVNYVRTIGQKLASNAKRKNEINYRFDIVESDEINAFTIPGGSVFVTTELLKYLNNEAELAAVLGHEIAHNDEKHAVESLRRAMIAQGAVQGGGQNSAILQTVANVTLDLILKGFSRNQEIEADKSGTILAVDESYSKEALLGFLQTLLNVSGGEPNGLVRLLLTHPATQERIDVLRQFYQESNINVANPIFNTEIYKQKIAVLPARAKLDADTKPNN